MEKINIVLAKENLAVAGETAGGNFSSGVCNLYSIEALDGKWKVELAHTFWDNGEEEFVAKYVYPEKLNIIKNRLRMVVSKCELPDYPGTKYVTLRMAFLKNEGTSEWTNLKNTSMGEISEVVDGNVLIYFKKLGAMTVDYKIDIFKQSGSSANQLVVIFPNDNIFVPIHAFVVTRVSPLIINLSS
jgi:hypothetical protein